MKAEWRLFGIIAVFLFIATFVYAGWTDGQLGHVDWIGSTALALSTLLLLMWAASSGSCPGGSNPRPEDRPDAEIADGAGEIGFFSPGSYWPFGLAVAASIAGLGLVFWLWWLIAVGLLSVIFAACGLLFEYYSGTRRTAEH